MGAFSILSSITSFPGSFCFHTHLLLCHNLKVQVYVSVGGDQKLLMQFLVISQQLTVFNTGKSTFCLCVTASKQMLWLYFLNCEKIRQFFVPFSLSWRYVGDMLGETSTKCGFYGSNHVYIRIWNIHCKLY